MSNNMATLSEIPHIGFISKTLLKERWSHSCVCTWRRRRKLRAQSEVQEYPNDRPKITPTPDSTRDCPADACGRKEVSNEKITASVGKRSPETRAESQALPSAQLAVTFDTEQPTRLPYLR